MHITYYIVRGVQFFSQCATGLESKEVHPGRFPRLPRRITEDRGECGRQSLEHDDVEICDLARERQRLVYQLVREHHAIASSSVARANERINGSVRKRPLLTGESWV